MSSSYVADENVSGLLQSARRKVRCLFNRLHGCFALCSGCSGGGREVVDGEMGPDWRSLAEGSDITRRRGPVV